MKEYVDGRFSGERALYQIDHASIRNCLFHDGESPLKETHDLDIKDTVFAWKYPLWYSHDFKVKDCTLEINARAGVWYSHDFSFENCRIDAPKLFRRAHSFSLKDIVFPNAEETLYFCKDAKLTNVKADNGAYFGLGSENLEIENLELRGDYAFDSSKNVIIKNSILHTKDAFWNCEDVTLINCEIYGEYFAWNSKRIKLVNCKINSHQGFCYMDDVVLENCDLTGTDLCFEYCSHINADVHGDIVSVKNPLSGVIKLTEVGEVIRDGNPDMDPTLTKIYRKAGKGDPHEI